MTVGSELKQARVRAGLSPEQISDRTKIQLYKIDALEKGDFELLPQGIYLDGIVRAYAHEVALDPDRMVERMRIERGKLPGDWEIPFNAAIDLHPAPTLRGDPRIVDVPGSEEALGGFAREDEIPASPAAPRVRPDADGLLIRNVPDLRPVPEQKFIVDDLRAASVSHASARSPRRRRRLALPLLLLLALAGSGAAYVWESFRPLDRETAADTALFPREGSAMDTAVSGAPVAPVAGRPGEQPIRSSADPVTDEETRPSDATANTSLASTGSRDSALGTSGSTPGAEKGAEQVPSIKESAIESAARPSSPASRPIDTGASAAPARAEDTATAGAIPNVSGSWKLDTRVESSSLGRFAGLQLGYEVQLVQDGDRVTGFGRKVSENGGGIRARAQTRISVNGRVNGDRLTLTFTEGGLQRSTQGKFVLLFEEDGTLRGRFSSDAARSSGRVEAHRLTRQ